MNTDVLQAINKELNNIRLRRHQLVFLITDNFKEDIRFVSEGLDVPYVNVNYELSEMLKDLSIKRRPRKVNELLKRIVREKNADTLVLDHTEILFDPQLHQNPVLLLEDISRNFTLIVGWKGQCYNRKLVYGEPEHDEYFTHDNTEGIIIEMK
ncbi:BREX-3 system P-loop-containing protein BrxF [Oceanobacillus oncorhynchi]|uniref:BREX-3 system P-loop-containing protein BrxF n=1 Tax=Oceanobacillus oncorhynchi TaxID=545501 RepID=UPI0025A34880|nr:BREX-3 system P-loop-containing protein BrxF [Oceanobacillus oncorhynchi]MDM8101340.1 BREX-3 system P-loop-containing protein BrxF [Oceanobacillus oncorhynchi]